jgi:hypothetical protein
MTLTRALTAATLMFVAVHAVDVGQAPTWRPLGGRRRKTVFSPSGSGVYTIDDALLRWPLRSEDARYGTIDGRHLHTFVVEQAAISRRFRDAGHLFTQSIQRLPATQCFSM